MNDSVKGFNEDSLIISVVKAEKFWIPAFAGMTA